MKRQHPLFTTLGFVLTVVLFAGLALSIWSSGGRAFSPGDLSAKSRSPLDIQGFGSHAEFETRCDLCHAPLQTTQDTLCLACHDDIARQITGGTGSHSRIEGVRDCAGCHSDHRGRDFDPTRGAYALFEHSETGFSLVQHNAGYDATPIQCGQCHDEGVDFSPSSSYCRDCHANHDLDFIHAHSLEFGADCLTCHDGADRMVSFDHQMTRFPLAGKHREARCAACHLIQGHTGDLASMPAGAGSKPVNDPFEDTPMECHACHTEPEIHQGLFDESCEQCHTNAGWNPARLDGSIFDHAASTGFSLDQHRTDFDGQPLVCSDCHRGDLLGFDLQTCADCHANGSEGAVFMQEHRAQFGDGCTACHDGFDRMSGFDHAAVFPLEGRHLKIACEQCHTDQRFVGTPGACVDCHTEPAIHAGFFGVQCQYCHTAQAWTPAPLRMHTFPLDHGSTGDNDCLLCHTSSYELITCFGCHEHQPEPIDLSHQRAGITPLEIPDCAKCHPSGTIGSGG